MRLLRGVQVARSLQEGKVIRIKDNPDGCVNPSKRGERTCTQCYWSQVNERNQWTGDQRCWNAQCLVADIKKEQA